MLAPSSPKIAILTRKTIFATAFSILFGGVGQWYLGQKKKAALVVIVTLIGLYFYVYLGVGLIILGMIDAFVIARRIQTLGFVNEWEFFWNRIKRVWQITDIVPTEKQEKPLGTEKRTVDNSKSSSTLRRNLRVKKEWSQSYSIEYERSRDKLQRLSLKVSEFMNVNKTTADTLKVKFAISQETRREQEEDIELEVPPGKKIAILLHWKHILQVGNIVYSDQYGEKVDVPFSIVSGLTFDQEQIDE